MQPKHESTKVPQDILDEQREKIANGTKRIDNILQVKASLAGRYATRLMVMNTMVESLMVIIHDNLHRDVEFADCNDGQCVRAKEMIANTREMIYGPEGSE